MYAKLRLLGHIQEKQKHNLFFEGQDGDRTVSRKAIMCSIYQDINLSPVPAWCDGVFGLQFLELGYELRNGFCVNSHIFMRQWRGLRVCQFMSLRIGMATIMTMKRHGK